jgi:hypothetical protein
VQGHLGPHRRHGVSGGAAQLGNDCRARPRARLRAVRCLSAIGWCVAGLAGGWGARRWPAGLRRVRVAQPGPPNWRSLPSRAGRSLLSSCYTQWHAGKGPYDTVCSSLFVFKPCQEGYLASMQVLKALMAASAMTLMQGELCRPPPPHKITTCTKIACHLLGRQRGQAQCARLNSTNEDLHRQVAADG